jgi:hypothetical protein
MFSRVVFPLLDSLSLWERVGESVLRLGSLLSYAPLRRAFSQKEKRETGKSNRPWLIRDAFSL